MTVDTLDTLENELNELFNQSPNTFYRIRLAMNREYDPNTGQIMTIERREPEVLTAVIARPTKGGFYVVPVGGKREPLLLRSEDISSYYILDKLD